MEILDVKYQIFISSTQKDLLAERNMAIETILKQYQFPVGMEMFNADNDTQWKVIRNTIDTSDLYILIVGHRYGSETKKGKRRISFTRKEFEYALKNKKRLTILAFIRDRNHPVNPVLIDHENTPKLLEFIDLVTNCGITVDFWTTSEDLGRKISLAVSKAIKKYEANGSDSMGWVKRAYLKQEQAQISNLINNRKSVYALLEYLAFQFKVQVEDTEKHTLDENGSCLIERHRRQTSSGNVTHSFNQYRSDKPGKLEMLEAYLIGSGTSVGKKLPFVVTLSRCS